MASRLSRLSIILLTFFSVFAHAIPLKTINGSLAQVAQIQSSVSVDGDCIDWREWLSNGYVASDCQQAIRLFVLDEVLTHMDKEFEFLAPGATALHTLPTMQTPRRYTIGRDAVFITRLIHAVS